MKTYFVLDNIDNLLKNGRLNKIVGRIISVLHIKPVMGADKDGNIALFSHARGLNQIVDKLADTIEKSGKKTEGQSMVITHCNNPTLAQKLMTAIQNRYRFKEILIVPTRGISSVYANDKGIVMAF
jgi:fatty acid-binding protein DegV